MCEWGCGVCHQPPAFSKCAADHCARPIVKHYPGSEWSWCYVIERQNVEKKNTKIQTNATFLPAPPFLKHFAEYFADGWSSVELYPTKSILSDFFFRP